MRVRFYGREHEILDGRAALEVAILQGRYEVLARTEDDAKVRRVLDVGAGCGAFALWAYERWPLCWIDCFEPEDDARALLEENGPPSMRVVDAMPEDLAVYDVIRIACPGAPPHSRPRSGALVVFDYVTRIR